MGLPTVTQTWTISPNNRYVFASVIGATGALMYSWSQFLITTMGWTCRGSCDGTTGAMDGVNRITAANKWATRNNGAAGAMSWIVVRDGAGVDWCYSFNSASDDIVRLAHSTGGNYVAAGTATFQPTATDEAFDSASGTWVNATASLDRVWHMWGNSDKRMARFAVLRAGAFVSAITTEKLISSLASPATFSLATGGGTVGALKGYFSAAIAGTSGLPAASQGYVSSTGGILCRLHSAGQDINTKCGISAECIANSFSSIGGNYFGVEKAELQGGVGELLFPANVGSVNLSAGANGKLGNPIDWWIAWASGSGVPALGDTFGALQFIALGNCIIWSWDGATLPASA